MISYDVVVRFRMRGRDPAPSRAARVLTGYLNDYSDGRYDFPVEMIHRGMVETFARVAGGAVIVDDGGVALAVEPREQDEDDLEGKWCVLCRDDRLPNGQPGPYEVTGRIFDDAEAARAYAGQVSSSRFPFIVEANKATIVRAVLNANPNARWGQEL